MRTRISFLLLPLLTLASWGVPLSAQDDDQEAPALLGRVIDAATGTPLVGAFVHLEGEDRGVLTDEEGRFELTGIGRGIIPVAVEQLGYVDLVHRVALPEDSGPITLAMEPDPLLLEGIRIVTDRFERRRRAVPVASQAFTREDLTEAPSFNVMDFLSSRSTLWRVPCSPYSVERVCALVRGRPRAVTVYLDEAPFLGGLDLLEAMMPHELHRIEVYRRGSHIRLYTEQFMERAGKTRLTPLAVFW